ncbi:ABC transporter permease [Pinisolibacter aquiterrae]|uniref:ABC transporter permease n=1 Tax=Pinisolibacter aquiterrae TaxID=2815579 RepID=UPI001C3C7097|nr:ABC transporter permease [Pinisolibacter aquiterrae]MCC8235444.1 ABC transporter permease [Pinisolibacter aquiterrae]
MIRKIPALAPLAGLAVFLLGWEIAVHLFAIPEFVLPAPSAMAATIWTEAGSLSLALAVTLAEALGGFALGIAAGLVIAMILVSAPPLEKAMLPLLVAINSVPVVAYTPLALIWLGIGSASKVTMVTLAVGFVVLLNMLHGLKKPEQGAIDLMRSFGAGRATIMWKLRLPAAMPSLVVALRVGIVRAMIVAIVTEMLGAYMGIGWIIFQATQQIGFREVWAAIAVSSLASMALYGALVWIDRRLVWWK